MQTVPASPEPAVDLRALAAEDDEFLWRWLHGTPDPKWKRWDAPYFHAADTQVPDRDTFAAAHARHVEDRHRRIVTVDGAPVGLVTRYEEAPAGGGWWELGILLFDPSRWGRGIGRRALAAWTDATFAETEAHLITLSSWSGNERMVACAQRVGYTPVARVPEARAWDGRRWDSVRLGLLRSQWEAAGTSAPDDDAVPPPPPDVAFREGEVPAADDLRRLYDAVGWSAYTQDMETLAAGVAGSSPVVTAWAGDALVGLARVVSDGHTIAYLQDVLVDPVHRRQGIASELLRRVFAPYAHVRQHVLITDAEPGQRAFYEAAGFREIRDGRFPGRAFVRFGG